MIRVNLKLDLGRYVTVGRMDMEVVKTVTIHSIGDVNKLMSSTNHKTIH